MDTIRVGIIGAGKNMRDRHMPGFRAVDDLEIAGVVNRSRESGERFAADFDVPHVADSVEALLADDSITAICIGTWPYMHRAFTIAALEAGKHVLCEARMSTDAANAEAMLAASEAHPDLVAQLVPSPLDLRLGPTITRLIAEGALGEILEVHVRALDGSGLDPETPLHWRHRIDYSGTNTMHLGLFQEMLQRWLGDSTRLIAHHRVFVENRADMESSQRMSIEIPDSVTIAADMAIGARATYQLSAVTAGITTAQVILYGTLGALQWTRGDAAQWARHGDELQELAPDSGTDRGWQVEADFARSIRDGDPVRLTNFPDGVRYMRFIDAARRSGNEGHAVDIEPLRG
jgi:predicted dehydrogenase